MTVYCRRNIEFPEQKRAGNTAWLGSTPVVVRDRAACEATGEAFHLEKMLEVRTRTRRAIWDIAQRIQPGMSEDDGRRVAAETLEQAGLRRGWHKMLVRFGPNTAKSYEEPSIPGVVLRDDDIFFIDIGPVAGGYEGDGGDTFVVGGDSEMDRAANDVKELWKAVRARWRDHGSTGEALYRFAAVTAEAMSWELDWELTGHRLSEFPHKAHFDGTLSEIGFHPAEARWVLEIQIRHRHAPFGAFFEDLLLEDDQLQRQSYEP